MSDTIPIPPNYQLEECTDLRGCGGKSTFRLRDNRKEASVLLHEIDSSILPSIEEAIKLSFSLCRGRFSVL